MIKTGGGEGGDRRTEGVEGFGRAFLSEMYGFMFDVGKNAIIPTLGALVGGIAAFVIIVSLGHVPLTLFSLASLAIGTSAVLVGFAFWLLKQHNRW